MNAAVPAIVVIGCFALAYRFYSRFLSERVFALDPAEPVPSVELEDGIDFVPTRLHVLWGNHYT